MQNGELVCDQSDYLLPRESPMIFMNRWFTDRLIAFDAIQVVHDHRADAVDRIAFRSRQKMVLIWFLSDQDAIRCKRAFALFQHTIREWEMMKNRGTDDCSKRVVLKRQMLSVTDDGPQRRHLLSRFSEHGQREVHSDHTCVPIIQQSLRHSSRAASHVKNQLIAQGMAANQVEKPAQVRLGNRRAVVMEVVACRHGLLLDHIIVYPRLHGLNSICVLLL